MPSLIVGLFWFLLFVGGGTYLAYSRTNLFNSTIATGSGLIAYIVYLTSTDNGSTLSFLSLLLLCVILALLVVLNLVEFRREKITRPALAKYRTMLPSMSDTEREALEAGSVSNGVFEWDIKSASSIPVLVGPATLQMHAIATGTAMSGYGEYVWVEFDSPSLK